jgi:hypothetical protein
MTDDEKKAGAALIDKLMSRAKSAANDYDPTAAAKKTIAKGATTALVVLSLLSGMAFSGPSDISQDQVSSQLNPTPIVMDIDDYVSSDVDDEDADEEKGSRVGIVAKFRQAVLSMPQAVRLLLITPLWAVGTGLMTAVSWLWSIIFSSPLGAFIASFAVGFGVLFALFAVTAKMLFPDIPLKKILSKKTVMALGLTALALAGADAALPAFWHEYPYYAAALKIGVAAMVIGIISSRIKKLNPLNSLKTI